MSAHQVHLKQSVTLYLFALPLVLVDDMVSLPYHALPVLGEEQNLLNWPCDFQGWLMVSVVSLVAFTLMGIEGIASQIENPFGALLLPLSPLSKVFFPGNDASF